MSRIARIPVRIPDGVAIKIEDGFCRAKGTKGSNELQLHPSVIVEQQGDSLAVKMAQDGRNMAMAGTTRALLANLVHGVSQGFKRELEIHGVGYRAQSKGKALNLTLGFSHPIDYAFPEGITISTPSPTAVVIEGIDRQKVGQVAAEIRALRPPEPYGGKGVRYKDEQILRKEVKKK
ncbi:MAG: 50S ribosomal protein L6 [Gammaproteobacteria bacterium]